MTTKKKRAATTRRPANGVTPSDKIERFAVAFGGEPTNAYGPRNQSVRPVHVVLDNTVPGGFRMEPV